MNGRRLHGGTDAAVSSSGALVNLTLASTLTLALVPFACLTACETSWDGRRGLDDVAKHGAVLVAAIQRCEQQTGWAPRDLGDLVPEYLDALPPTGCPTNRSWSYSTQPDVSKPRSRRPGEWKLWLFVDRGGLDDFDEIVYAPDPSKLGEWKVERSVGNWRYCTFPR
jgi:hypothetical protein